MLDSKPEVQPLQLHIEIQNYVICILNSMVSVAILDAKILIQTFTLFLNAAI